MTAIADHVYLAARLSMASIDAPEAILTCCRKRPFREPFDSDPGDAVAIHRRYRVAPPVVFDRLPPAGNFAQAVQQKSGQRLESRIRGDLNPVLRFQVENPRGAIHLESPRRRAVADIFDVVLVFNPPHDLLE